jgi:AraC-like DNA-binding protein
VEVLWTARYDYQPHWRLEKHKHAYFQMIYFVSGTGCISIGENEHPITAGSFLLIKPGCLHALNPSSLVKTLDIKFMVRDRRLRKLLLSAAELVEENEPRIADLFERIRHEGEHRGYLYRELCSAFLAELLFVFLRKGHTGEHELQSAPIEQEPSGDWIVQRAARFIREHHADDCSLMQLARIVGRSDRHVRQRFKSTLGVSPRRYLLQYRIHRAQELIEYSGDSFKEIASKVGFKSVHHFARAFHEICGETPGAWRRKYQAGICKDVNIDPEFVNRNWTVQADDVLPVLARATGTVMKATPSQVRVRTSLS